MQLNKYLFIILSFIIVVSCNDSLEKDKRINFIGDSIIARWPIDETLPSQLVYNYGESGARIDYIEMNKGKFSTDDIVVVIIGTNNSSEFYGDEIETFVDRYLTAISGLGSEHIYLFSILPRNFTNDPDDINLHIKIFNDKVQGAIDLYPHIVYIDVFDKFIHKNDINYQYYSDGLHLNIYGYELLSSILLNKLYN